MSMLSLFLESVKVANRLERLNNRDGLENAERLIADQCANTPKQTAQRAASGWTTLRGAAALPTRT